MSHDHDHHAIIEKLSKDKQALLELLDQTRTSEQILYRGLLKCLETLTFVVAEVSDLEVYDCEDTDEVDKLVQSIKISLEQNERGTMELKLETLDSKVK